MDKEDKKFNGILIKKSNKKERTKTLHEELMEGFEMEKKIREENDE